MKRPAVGGGSSDRDLGNFASIAFLPVNQAAQAGGLQQTAVDLAKFRRAN